jgi:[histone H3]-lysine9 N-trimethyltransferase SUV39H
MGSVSLIAVICMPLIWLIGLRCPEDIPAGRFIDTYRGEIITSSEAQLREATSSQLCYLYDLDKFGEQLEDVEMYTMDARHYGGPVRFVNHSCDPNCATYTVSLNKNDLRVYELALFATKKIPAFTELTFDYKNADSGAAEPIGEAAKDTPCLCGTEKCRGWLWA